MQTEKEKVKEEKKRLRRLKWLELKLWGKEAFPVAHKIYGLDVETGDFGKFAFGYVVTEKDDLYFDDPQKLADFLNQEVDAGIFIFAMNTEYDLNSIFPYFARNHLSNTGHFILTLFEDKEKHFNIGDIKNFYQNSTLKMLAKDFGLEYIDKHFLYQEGIKEACLTHARASRDIMVLTQKALNSIKVELKITGASTAMAGFEKNFTSEMLFNRKQDYVQNVYVRQSYKGGATEAFRTGKFKNVTMVDVISMYPDAMRNNLYPDIYSWRMHYSTNLDVFLKDLFEFEGVATVEIDIPYSKIPYFTLEKYKDKSTSLYGDNILMTLTFPAIRYMLTLGCKINNVFQYILYRKVYNNLFKEYVDTLFKMKSDKSAIEFKPVAKLLLNALYGKFGQVFQNIITYEIKEAVEDVYNEVDTENQYENDGIIFCKRKCYETVEFTSRTHFILCSYVTEYSRIKLHKAMMALGEENILYCDTDSIAVHNLTLEQIQERIKIGTGLGDFEVKWVGDMEIKAPKNYRFRPRESHDKTKPQTYWSYVSKGVPKQLMEEFWREDEAFLTRPRKRRSAIINGLPMNEWISFRYVKGIEVPKREFFADGDSKPLKYK